MSSEVEKYIATWLSTSPHFYQVYFALKLQYPRVPELKVRQTILETVGRKELFLFDVCAYCGRKFPRGEMISSLTTVGDPHPVNFCSLDHVKLYDNKPERLLE